MLKNSPRTTSKQESIERSLNFFGISEEDMLDSSKVKVICGIAGSAKSSNIDRFFHNCGIDYGRYTSTNKLKRDARDRYGCFCDTIAGGLFNTDNGIFFADEKEVPFENIVIDEILQTDARVIDWIQNNKGKYNIIVTTDIRQMLSAEDGKTILKAFQNLCGDKDTIYVELSKTYRARDEKTERYFHICYNSVREKFNRFKADSKWFKQISFSEMRYNHNDVFICHSNDIELMLYREWDIYHDYSAELLPKGSIARKEDFDVTRYPIIPQAQTPKANIPYLQPVNVGSVTRYQGSEVTKNQTLYFLVGRNDWVNNREWYTAVTRLWTIDNIVIVWCDIKKIEKLIIYNGKPVKETGWFSLTEDVKLSDGTMLSEISKSTSARDIILSDLDMLKIIEKIPQNSDLYYNRNAVIFGEKLLKRNYKNNDNESRPRNAPTMLGYLQKEPDFSYDYMPDFYRSLEYVQKNRFPGAKMTKDILLPPSIVAKERGSETPFPDNSSYENIRSRDSFQYGIDFRASYPCILHNEILPTGSFFYPRDKSLKDNEFHTSVYTGMIDWYISYCDIFPEGCIVTGQLVRFVQNHIAQWAEFYYIGTSSCKKGSDMGDKLYKQAYYTKESKALIKYVHYGLAERPYLERIDFDENGENKAYAVNKTQNHQLLMLAIRSYQCLNVLKLMYSIYGDFIHGIVNADCLYFDSGRRISNLGRELEELVPGYDFRIFDNQSKSNKIIFQTYADLPTAKELAKEKRKNKLDKTEK
nr:MAG TPA: exodeoxyribonuclease V subunit [Bacteriophage sp.]